VRRARVAGLLPEALIFGVAVVVRVVPVTTSGGLHGNYGYDSSVYYAVADGLVHGQLPYRDTLLLHPPVSALVLAPFAWAGSLTTAMTGFVAANLFMTGVSAMNAVLVVRVAQRFGLPRLAAVAGGAFYALWWITIQAEYLGRLEVIGNFFLLVALFALARSLQDRTPRWFAGFGAALTLAASTKIWFLVPAVVLVGWQVAAIRRPRLLAWTAAGAAGAGLLVDGPFFAAAPHRMVYMVLQAQLGRARTSGVWLRLLDIVSGQAFGQANHAVTVVSTFVGLVILSAAVAGSVRSPAARGFAALLGINVAVLLVSPPWFRYYADFLSVPAALCVAGAVSVATERRWPRLVGWVPVALAAAQAVILIGSLTAQLVAPFPNGPAMAAAAAAAACVKSDSPMALIELDALDRSFAPGCQDWGDVLAGTFGAGKKADRLVPGQPDPAWNFDLNQYLTSGDAVMLMRSPRVIGLPTADELRIEQHSVITSDGLYTLYATGQSRYLATSARR